MAIAVCKNIACIKKLRENGIHIIEKEREDFDYGSNFITINILNLMPNKSETEEQFLRILGRVKINLNINFMRVETYTSKNTSGDYLNSNYVLLREIRDIKSNGMIVTGAPLEKVNYENISYWNELRDIMSYCHENVDSTLYICWAAVAALYSKYNISSELKNEKIFGIYDFRVEEYRSPLLKELGATFGVPQSRYMYIDENEVCRNSKVNIISSSKECGANILESNNHKEIYFLGHIEYGRDTLHKEYTRDLKKKLDINLPHNYYEEGMPKYSWKEQGEKFYNNWVEFLSSLNLK